MEISCSQRLHNDWRLKRKVFLQLEDHASPFSVSLPHECLSPQLLQLESRLCSPDGWCSFDHMLGTLTLCSHLSPHPNMRQKGVTVLLIAANYSSAGVVSETPTKPDRLFSLVTTHTKHLNLLTGLQSPSSGAGPSATSCVACLGWSWHSDRRLDTAVSALIRSGDVLWNRIIKCLAPGNCWCAKQSINLLSASVNVHMPNPHPCRDWIHGRPFVCKRCQRISRRSILDIHSSMRRHRPGDGTEVCLVTGIEGWHTV